LKAFKTPFLVAATKIDRIPGWKAYENKPFLYSFERQSEPVKQRLEELVYTLVAQLSEHGFDAERFDRVTNFKTTVAIVPCSGVTGEGIQELLMVVCGLAQAFLKDKLEIKGDVALGSILEVKEMRGFGRVIDAIFYDGVLKRGDYLVIGGKEIKVTRIKAILKPKPLKEIRVEKQFVSVNEVHAACGVRIAAQDLEGAIAGMPIAATSDKNKVEELKEMIRKDIESIEFEVDEEGIVVKADTLGSLDALLNVLRKKGISVKKAEVGNVSKSDVMLADAQERYNRVILGFNVSVDELAEKEAKNRNVKIFINNVIYRLIEEFEKWVEEEKRREIEEKLAMLNRPAKIRILPGFVFRVSKPAIVGIEVLEGVLKPGVTLIKPGREIGEVKELQREGENIEKAEKGERCAISIDGGFVGRNIKEGDVLYTKITREDYFKLREMKDYINEEELNLAKEILRMFKDESS